MPIFQKSVISAYLKKYDTSIDIRKKVNVAFKEFIQYYGDSERIENIRMLKEENYQEGFLREIFVDVLGYTINPNVGYNLSTEYKNEKDSKKADGAIIRDKFAIAVIELKSTKTVDMLSIESQAFNYKRNHKGCRYVITSNFEKLHFYMDDYSVEYEEFNLFGLKDDFESFKRFYLILSHDSIIADLPIQIKNESYSKEIQITKELYKNYLLIKTNLFNDLVEQNKNIDKFALLKFSQKIFDRILFILFAEDRDLLPPNTLLYVVKEYNEMKEKDEYRALYYFLRKYFNYIDVGCNRNDLKISAYNGELFKPNPDIDNLVISDNVLMNGINILSKYDFLTDVDVDILGHIFENSLNDIEEMQARIQGIEFEEKQGKRKKDGIFYTPKYITKYIINSTLGALCLQKKKELEVDEINLDITKEYKRLGKDKKILLHNLLLYRSFLLSLKIIDPACGSGAFLIQALNFLVNEHEYVERYRKALENDTLGLWEIEKEILENNLFGVDINEEAIEIAKLSIWLRTAEKGRKLNNLSSCIKCGNSLVDNKNYDSVKYFNWEKEFPNVFLSGKFNIVIGNPPYVRSRDNRFETEKDYFLSKYKLFTEKPNLYILFMEKAIELLKEKDGYFGFIIPNSWLGIESAEPLRRFLIKNMQFKSVINLLGESFPGVNVETSILIYQNKKPNDNTNYQTIYEEGIPREKFKQIDQLEWLNNRSCIIDIRSIKSETKLLNKIISSSDLLSTNYDVFVGLQAYETGKGIPQQTEESVKKHIFDYRYKFDGTTYKYLGGSDVLRYSINWAGQWLRYGSWLSQPREISIFSLPRILIREIISPFPYSLNCTYTEDCFLNNKSILNILKKSDNCLLKYLLAILNSKLISFFLIRRAVKGNRNLFPKVVAEDLKNLPIRIISIGEQEILVNIVDKIITLSSQLNTKKAKFLNRLKTLSQNITFTKNIEKFYLYDFNVFIAELKRQKIRLTLIEQDEWEDYFNSYSSEIKEIEIDIEKNNAIIDNLVYEIYELSQEEINTISNSQT